MGKGVKLDLFYLQTCVPSHCRWYRPYFVSFVKVKCDTEKEIDTRDEQLELEIVLAFC